MGKTHKREKKSKKKHKHKERKEKKKSKKVKKYSKDVKLPSAAPPPIADTGEGDFAIPLDLMNSKSYAPETPEEYEKRQSRIRKEVDPITGRIRLIKGDGEVLEEIVSKERHKTINKEATKGDGDYYEKQTLGKFK